MSKDHPLQLHFKMEFPEVTVHNYRNDGMRVEITVNHEAMSIWLMTLRIITLDRLAFVTDTLWKYPDSSALAVDIAFATLTRDLKGGMTPNTLVHRLFLDEWGCVILDDLPKAGA